MALLERVSTLLRANLNDMMDRAEDPAKMLKQLLLDMENQLIQVKTQVAIAIADQHLLESKTTEHEQAVTAWRRKAELALNKDDEPLARAALERSLQSEQLLAAFTQQLQDQRTETETLRDNYTRLTRKLEETTAQGELLLAQQRRARNAVKTPVALPSAKVLNKLKEEALRTEAKAIANRTLAPTESLEDRFAAIEREDRIDTLLNELKAQPRLLRG